MKDGKSLVDLAREIERQREVKHDYIADSTHVEMSKDAKAFTVANVGTFGITDHARKQLAAKLDIPVAYFNRLEEKHPDLLSTNVNELLHREPSRSMVRTLDGKVRAIMSDRYRPLDNYDLANAVLPPVMDAVQSRGAVVQSCDITETKLYIKVLMPWLDRELPVPEGLKMGVGHNFFVRKIIGALTISNSEIGAGMLAINPGIFEKQCTNLASFKDEGFGKMHIGKKNGGEDPVAKYLSDETRRIDDAAVWARVRDVLSATMDGRVMDSIVAKMNAARGDIIDVNPADVVEVFSKKNGINETEKGGLLRHLTNSGEMTRYGLQWAVTRLANDAETYDRASELERLGGQVIELPQTDWRQLLKAA